jgi:hypothetical protein
MAPEIRPLLTIRLLPWLLCLLAGCATSTPVADLAPIAEQDRTTELQLAIMALGNDIDRDEARLAASIAIEYPLELAQQYEITDPPLVHNTLVNLGVKSRGLCTDWAVDLLTRLRQERFRSLELHWGIANYENLFRLEHSTVIISARGDSLQQGLVLDPWRYGGLLYWAKTLEDSVYQWYPHAEIFALKRERKVLALNRPEER